MLDDIARFVTDLTKELIDIENYQVYSQEENQIQVSKDDGTIVSLDLRPFVAQPLPASAGQYFAQVYTVTELYSAYHEARKSLPFEGDIAGAMDNVSSFSKTFIDNIFTDAENVLTDTQAALIANWVKDLDIYTSVKAVESLLNSRADLTLLEIAKQNKWTVHFDHLAIRCGSKANGDAERVVEMLKQNHGYSSTQFPEQAFYQFSDGWNAYPLYKILSNGQVLRLFIDQSDANAKSQIIQHWNKIYGYTAHHLAIRATQIDDESRKEIYLDDLMHALKQRQIEIMTPTGYYTKGMLLQVFTRPQKQTKIPGDLKRTIVSIDKDLDKKIENAKLLELVSRKEMSHELAGRFFQLYGIQYDQSNPLHSAPVYQYFLPAQAAHVINTSIQ